jgi:IS30 family transposase
MEQLSQLRMQKHELTMRQMVEEIHRGHLNIEQAAKFEVNRKTVKHWLGKVESETRLAGELYVKESILTSAKKKTKSPRLKEHPSTKVLELEAKVYTLEQELEKAKFKALYYSTLVRVAEQDLGIDIEKKSVTK